MSQEEKRSPEKEASAAEPPLPRPRQRKSRKKAKASLFTYLGIMLVTVILLLMLSYVMQLRKNAETLSGINDSMAGLKESVSAMQTIEDIRQENQELLLQVEELEDQLANLGEENTALSGQLGLTATERDQAQKSLEAMDWLWRMEQLYNTRYYTACRAMMEKFEEAGLKEALPTSASEEGELSAAEEYERLYNSLH